MGYDGKVLGKTRKCIQNPSKISIRPRNECLGYECHTSNGDTKVVKSETSIENELWTSINVTNQEKKHEQCCSHECISWHV